MTQGNDQTKPTTANDRHNPVSQTQTADSRSVVALLYTAGYVRGRLSAFFRDFELTTNQYNVLRILRGAGPLGLPSQEIARRVIERVPDMTRLVNRLETADLVKRGTSSSDGRIRTVSITPRGRRRLEPIDEPLRILESDLFAKLSEEDHATLGKLLAKVRYDDSH